MRIKVAVSRPWGYLLYPVLFMLGLLMGLAYALAVVGPVMALGLPLKGLVGLYLWMRTKAQEAMWERPFPYYRYCFWWVCHVMVYYPTAFALARPYKWLYDFYVRTRLIREPNQ